MKLDVATFRYMSREDFRILSALEIAHKNHEIVPMSLIEALAALKRGATFKLTSDLLRRKLIAHDGGRNEGYKLTYLGYDYLALRALAQRGIIHGVGRRIGVGKESDIHVAITPEGREVVLKFHRLGRTSFRTIKKNRDYLQHRRHASWMYMARLAATKEVAYMRALHEKGFPVPEPLDHCRHAVVMSLVKAVPLSRMRELPTNAAEVLLEKLFRLLVKMAHAGLVHGDFNEYNLMVNVDWGDEAGDDDEEPTRAVVPAGGIPHMDITVIDFPQIVTAAHPNAGELFERDAKCLVDFFARRFNFASETMPRWKDVAALATQGLEEEIRRRQEKELRDGVEGGTVGAMGFISGLSAEEDGLLVDAHELDREKDGEEAEPEEDDSSDDEVPLLENVGDGAEDADAWGAAADAQLAQASQLEDEQGSASEGEESEAPDEAGEGQDGEDGEKVADQMHVLRRRRHVQPGDARKKLKAKAKTRSKGNSTKNSKARTARHEAKESLRHEW